MKKNYGGMELGIKKVINLNCATFSPLFEISMNGSGRFFRNGCFVTNCLLIETTEAGLILIDTGFSRDDIGEIKRIPFGLRVFFRPKMCIEETAYFQIKKYGYNVRDVRNVIFTHLDVDHANGIADFPWAKGHCSTIEYENAINKIGIKSKMRYKGDTVKNHKMWEFYDSYNERIDGLNIKGQRIKGVNEDIYSILLGGHSSGNCAIAIKENNGWILHSGDAYMNQNEISDKDNYKSYSGLFQLFIQNSNKKRIESLQKIRQLKLEHKNIKIICSHDKLEHI
jgi:glyoxylase-like metal-dependent hydrolase (beta-lactamase superfamily II)